MKYLTPLIVVVLSFSDSAVAEFPEFLDASITEAVQPVVVLIPGQLFGSGSKDLVIPLASGNSPNISFPLYVLKSVAEQGATKQTKKSEGDGLIVDPVETRIMRFGTYAKASGNRDRAGNFYDVNTGNLLLLVYVDRPCRIEGEVMGRGKVYVHEIDFNRAGFHWVSEVNSGLLKNVANSTKVEFRVGQ